jgi:Na+-transporting NADH:ubiquinone oxidoreductase subunit A
MLFKPKKPQYTGSNKVYFLKRGYNMNLVGAAAKQLEKKDSVKTFGVQPPNFRGIVPIPRVTVDAGDQVLAGDLLFYDKKRPYLKFVAPVSGTVTAVQRGLRRSIKEVVIEADNEIRYRKLDPPDYTRCAREELVEFLLESGAWPFIRQRPYNIIAEKEVIPNHIFISTFDTAPLAPDLDFVMSDRGESFQEGLNVLTKLTSGSVHLGLNANNDTAPSAVFRSAENVRKHYFHGMHPAGNVGIQIHHIDRIVGDKKIWTLNVQDVALIGDLFLNKRFNGRRIVALTGSEITGPKYIDTYIGASISELTTGEVNNAENIRFISGDVLSGEQKNKGEFLNAFDDQVTAIPEGKSFEMFGWLFPGVNRPSVSRTYLNHLFKNRIFRVTTNTRGERRSMVVTGEYESVLPMDLHAQHLMKSIITNDLKKMEGLGIQEIEAEDIALCEFACTSKQPLQKILYEGQQAMIEM